MSKYIVTGGLGFIGYHLTTFLLERGHNVIVVDNVTNGQYSMNNEEKLLHNYSGVNIYIEDIINMDTFSENEEFDDVEGIFHLAAIPRVQMSLDSPQKTTRNNIEGTVSVLEFARKNNINKVVFASSSSVYGKQTKERFSEDLETNPISPYAIQKLTGEKLMKMYNEVHGMKTSSLRFFSVYGTNQDETHPYALLIPKAISCAIKDKPFPLFGTGTNQRDFTHVKDVVIANYLMMTHNHGMWGQVFNVGAGDPKSVLEVLTIIENTLGKDINIDSKPPRVEPRLTCAENNKIFEAVGWEPRIGIKQGIKQCVNYMKKSYEENKND